jgi:hypothetical protein
LRRLARYRFVPLNFSMPRKLRIHRSLGNGPSALWRTDVLRKKYSRIVRCALDDSKVLARMAIGPPSSGHRKASCKCKQQRVKRASSCRPGKWRRPLG